MNMEQVKQPRFFISGVVDDGEDCLRVPVNDPGAQFWSLYRRNDDGTADALFDLVSRRSAEEALQLVLAMQPVDVNPASITGLHFASVHELAAAIGSVTAFHQMSADLIAEDIFKTSRQGFLSHAISDVIAERKRQQTAEGWTPEHDDMHNNGEMAFAAASYAFHAAAATWDLEDCGTEYDIHPAPKNWPWDAAWWKPTNQRRDLVKAAALIVAEIERLDRAAANDKAQS